MALSCPTAVWLLLVSANLVTGTTAPPEQSGSQGGQAGPYCTPDNWIGGRAVTTGVIPIPGNGIMTMTRSVGDLTYAAQRRKLAVEDAFSTTGDGELTRRIFDYPAKTLFTITGNAEQKCVKTSLPGPFPFQCVPGTSNMTLADSYLGVGDNSVKAFQLQGQQDGLNYSITLTSDSYIPIYKRYWGTITGVFTAIRIFETNSFFNISVYPDIPESAFAPPASCTHVRVSERSTEQAGIHPFILFP